MHPAIGKAVRLEVLRQMQFNSCVAVVVVVYDKPRILVRRTQGPQHVQGREIRVKGPNAIDMEQVKAQQELQLKPRCAHWPGGAQQPLVQRVEGKNPVEDTPNTLPGNWYQMLGVRSPRATTERSQQVYTQLSVKVQPNKNPHHREKAEDYARQ